MEYKLSEILMNSTIKRQYEIEFNITLKRYNDFDNLYCIKEIVKYYKQFKNIKIDKLADTLLKTMLFLKDLFEKYNVNKESHGIDILSERFPNHFTKDDMSKLHRYAKLDGTDKKLLNIIYKKLKNEIDNFYYKTYDINKLRQKKYERIL